MAQRRLSLGCFAFCAVLICRSALAQDIGPVLPYLPTDANTLCVFDVTGLINSPRGKAEGWAEKHAQGYLDGSLTLPPWVTLFVRGSHFIPGSGELWTTALTPVGNDFQIAAVAQRENADIQEIRGLPSVQSARYGGYFVELTETGSNARWLGLLLPASRQQVANWLQGARAGTTISRYLQQAAQLNGAQLVLAFDMEDMLDPVQIRYRLNGAASVKSNNRAKSALTIDFQSLQGVRLAVTATDTVNAQLRLDFKREIGSESEFIKPLITELLRDAGVELPEFDDAAVSVSGMTVTLKTPLSDESFRKILSLIITPHPATQTPLAETPPPATTTTPSPEAANDMAESQKYYQAVIRNLADLEKSYQAQNPSYVRSAGWHETYANRIDRLPTTGVHPSLQAFAAEMSQGLRVLAKSLRGTDVDIKSLESKVWYQTEYKYAPKTGVEWWWGPPVTTGGYVMTPSNTQVIVHSNVEDVRTEQLRAVEAGSAKRNQIWQNMANQRDAVEQEMTRVFGRTFLSN